MKYSFYKTRLADNSTEIFLAWGGLWDSFSKELMISNVLPEVCLSKEVLENIWRYGLIAIFLIHTDGSESHYTLKT